MPCRQIPDQIKNITESLSTLTAAVNNISTINNNLNKQYEKKDAECTGLRNENIHLKAQLADLTTKHYAQKPDLLIGDSILRGLHQTKLVRTHVTSIPVLTAKHYTTRGQHGSMAALNNIGQLIKHGHYSELRIIHSGDVQPNPGPVSGSSRGLTPGASSSLASGMPKGLKIGEWNVQSLYNKTEQIRHMLDAEGNHIHILGVTETWLNNSRTDSEIAIYGYNLERCDRTECHGGGVALYVHESVT